MTELATRTSALPAVPARAELEAMSPADLWTLEERASEVQDACREINDARLRHWIEVEGKTQTEVATLVGRSQARISQRCSALGIVSTNARTGRPKGLISTDKSAFDGAEEVDAELVEDDEEYATSPHPSPTRKPEREDELCPMCGQSWPAHMQLNR